MSSPIAPWHLWGSSVLHRSTLQAVTPSPFDTQGEVRQLARINYRRPDTWSFMFGVVIVDRPNNVAAVTVTIRVDFELTIGIGRSSITLKNGAGNGQGFARLVTSYTTPVTQLVPQAVWTTIAQTPNVFAGPSQALLQSFPAEDIQCNARIFGTSGAPLLGQPFQVEVHSYFAPRSHIRPEWYAEDSQFRGNETGGT